MPQPPFLIDQVQIEPGTIGTRLINNNAATGELKFTDAVTTGGLVLSQLAGLRNITNVFIVGKAGSGAQYTTVQAALDDVPSSASGTNPYNVVVFPGRYDETLNIIRDGVRLIGIGQPELRSALEATPDAVGNDHTLIISAQSGTIPLTTIIENFIITNAHTNKAAVRVVSVTPASTVGNGVVLIRNCDVRANSTAGNNPLWATAVNYITVEGGDWLADDLALVKVEECARVIFNGTRNIPGMSLRYDDANNEPASTREGYFLYNTEVGNNSTLNPTLSVDNDGDSLLYMSDVEVTGNFQVSGDQTATMNRSRFKGSFSILETTTAYVRETTVVGATNINATATLDNQVRRGTAVFGAVAFVDVVLGIPFPDASYHVAFEVNSRPTNDETPWISNKLATGFRINFQTAQTLSVFWMTTRL